MGLAISFFSRSKWHLLIEVEMFRQLLLDMSLARQCGLMVVPFFALMDEECASEGCVHEQYSRPLDGFHRAEALRGGSDVLCCAFVADGNTM